MMMMYPYDAEYDDDKDGKDDDIDDDDDSLMSKLPNQSSDFIQYIYNISTQK